MRNLESAPCFAGIWCYDIEVPSHCNNRLSNGGGGCPYLGTIQIVDNNVHCLNGGLNSKHFLSSIQMANGHHLNIKHALNSDCDGISFSGWAKAVSPQPGGCSQQQLPEALDGDHLCARIECKWSHVWHVPEITQHGFHCFQFSFMGVLSTVKTQKVLPSKNFQSKM